MDDLDQATDVAPEPAAEPAPTPAPEPAAEPAPEPEPVVGDHQPAFLDEPAAPQQPQEPQWSPEQVAAYNYQQRLAQQQAAQPQPPQADEVLNRFVRDPRETIGSVAGPMAQQIARDAVQQQLGPVSNFLEGQTNYFSQQASNQIRNMYDTSFNRDETFVSNDRVQRSVDNTMTELWHQARSMAQRGDPSGFAKFADPTFPSALLAMAKAANQVKPSAAGAASAPHTERVAPTAQPPEIELTPDQEEAVARFGRGDPAFRARYIQGIKDAEKHGDYQG